MLVSRILGDYHVNGWPMSQCGPPKKPHCWTTMRVEYLKSLTCNWSGNHVTLYLHYTCLQAYLVNAWFTNSLSNKQVQRAEKYWTCRIAETSSVNASMTQCYFFILLAHFEVSILPQWVYFSGRWNGTLGKIIKNSSIVLLYNLIVRFQ